MATPKKTAQKRASGNPAKRAEAQAHSSSVADFKKRRQGTLLTLPSSLTMTCRRVELTTFIKQGSIPNDLMPIIDQALNKGQEVKVEEMISKDGHVDLDMVNDMYSMVNAVVCQVSVEPKVSPIPTQEDVEQWNAQHPEETVEDPEDLRDDGLLYVDEVDDEDKMFLFQWSIGGTSDLAQFRQGLEADLGSLAEGAGSKRPTKRAAGARKR